MNPSQGEALEKADRFMQEFLLLQECVEEIQAHVDLMQQDSARGFPHLHQTHMRVGQMQDHLAQLEQHLTRMRT